MKRILVALAIAASVVGLLAAPASADHTKGKKYRDVELTRQNAIDANDPFGVAPPGSSGDGAMYLNVGQERFCLFLDFELPEDTVIAALHLHEKVPGTQSGPIVIDATELIAEDGLSTQGCVEGDREFLRGLLSSPSDYYVNAHTDDTTTPDAELTVVRAEFGRN